MKAKVKTTILAMIMIIASVCSTINAAAEHVETAGVIMVDRPIDVLNYGGFIPGPSSHMEDIPEDDEGIIDATIVSDLSDNEIIPVVIDGELPEEEVEEETEAETEPETETETPELVSLGTFKVTAYCNCSICCGKYAGGKMKNGEYPVAGRSIATYPSQIPTGTHVWINGHEYIAEDTGSAIKKNCIDIYMNSHQEALNWGVQHIEVFVAK